MLKIRNLTPEQVAMLNTLWGMESMEEIRTFQAGLSRKGQQAVETLLEMVRLQLIDDEIDKRPMELGLAQEMLWPFVNKKG